MFWPQQQDFTYQFPLDTPICSHRSIEAFGGNNVTPMLYASYTHVPSGIKGYQYGKAASRVFFDVLGGIKQNLCLEKEVNVFVLSSVSVYVTKFPFLVSMTRQSCSCSFILSLINVKKNLANQSLICKTWLRSCLLIEVTIMFNH